MSTDFILDNNTYDISLTNAGDIAKSTDNDTIINGVVRRIATPTVGYARMVRIANTVNLLDTTYGTEFVDYLSAPINELTPLISIINQAASLDGRMTILNTNITPTSSPNTVAVNVTFNTPYSQNQSIILSN